MRREARQRSTRGCAPGDVPSQVGLCRVAALSGRGRKPAVAGADAQRARLVVLAGEPLHELGELPPLPVRRLHVSQPKPNPRVVVDSPFPVRLPSSALNTHTRSLRFMLKYTAPASLSWRPRSSLLYFIQSGSGGRLPAECEISPIRSPAGHAAWRPTPAVSAASETSPSTARYGQLRSPLTARCAVRDTAALPLRSARRNGSTGP